MQIAIIGADERTPALKRCLMESGIGIIEITEQNIRRLMQSQIIVLPFRYTPDMQELWIPDL